MHRTTSVLIEYGTLGGVYSKGKMIHETSRHECLKASYCWLFSFLETSVVLARNISTLPSYYCNGACPLSEACARIFKWNHWAGRDGREVRRVAMLVHLVGGSRDSRRERNHEAFDHSKYVRIYLQDVRSRAVLFRCDGFRQKLAA